jgi:hypothetical protein
MDVPARITDVARVGLQIRTVVLQLLQIPRVLG